MPVELLIDGYNLLHNAGLGKSRYRAGEFERARDRLLKRLFRALTSQERQHTTVIFDAQYAERKDRKAQHIFGMSILFSPHGRQADDMIEMLLAGHSSPEQVLVISSDHRLQRAARYARASYLDSDSFLVELDQRESEIQAEQKNEKATRAEEKKKKQPSRSSSADDTTDWLAEFGDIDVAAITKEVARETSRKSPKKNPPSPKTETPEKKSSTDRFSTGKSSTGKSSQSKSSQSKATQSEFTQSEAPRNSPSSSPPPLHQPQPEPDEETNPDYVAANELSFWEQRIADMLSEETE